MLQSDKNCNNTGDLKYGHIWISKGLKESIIYSQLSRYSKAKGSSSGLSQGGPTKVKASKSFLFTDGFLRVENKENFIDFVVTLNFYHFA